MKGTKEQKMENTMTQEIYEQMGISRQVWELDSGQRKN